MKRTLLTGLYGIVFLCLFFSCKEGKGSMAYAIADSLNTLSYKMRYKNLDESERLALSAWEKGNAFSSIKAEALNNLGFCAFIRMDFEKSDSLFKAVYRETSNELECLVADIGLMKIYQRTAMNKEYYDYRNSALKRMKRISDDAETLADARIRRRYHYARTDFYITSAIYYYYLQQEEQSLEAIHEIDVEEELKEDTAQWLYYDYMKGSGGLYVASSPEEIVVGEFDYLLDCLSMSHEQGYLYFEANSSQAMAELLKTEKNYHLLIEKRPGLMRLINANDLPWEGLVMRFSERAISLFKQYGDWYQIAGSYRTKASCLNEQERYEEALECLSEALSYVNLHHEKYYHCHDSIDRLKSYIPQAVHSIELEWINKEGIKTVPEWIARFREQLSVTYAALGMKPESDYNRNIYLDMLDYTRQDKELESRYAALEKESGTLTVMLVLVMAGVVLLVLLLWVWNRHWRARYQTTIGKLEKTLEVCRMVTASVPGDAEDVENVIHAIIGAVKDKIMELVGATDMVICLDGAEEEIDQHTGKCTELLLETADNQKLGVWKVYSDFALKKDDKALLKVISPYISWTLENGLAVISLGEERRMLEKEQYVYEQHLIENKRQNLIKKACMFIVTGINPYIDRVMNEVHKLTAMNYLSRKEIKEGKYHYIGELTDKINEYNDILALWIKMRQGALNLNIENFELNPLFEVLQKGKKNFEAKKQHLDVHPTEAVVKADKALTLFMINTLADNARKYTPQGGEISVYAEDMGDCVEISVKDNGVGLSQEDIQCILGEKVYDSGKIGASGNNHADELKKNKGYGFGLMNCKGIIEKYRKTNELFRVCSFHIESEIGKGSRFCFRLPKGVRKALGVMALLVSGIGMGCTSSTEGASLVETDSLFTAHVMEDTLLQMANHLANEVYEANLDGRFQDAIAWADSALDCLNRHYLQYAGKEAPLLVMEGEGSAAELAWFAQLFDTDYYTLLDVRNEAAVACLALGNLEGYRYNNQAYTALYKQISVDSSLAQYCEQMENSANNKFVGIVLCVMLLFALLLGYYLLYFRHLMSYRYDLEQVMEINRQLFTIPMQGVTDPGKVASLLAAPLYNGINELLPIHALGISLYGDESKKGEFVWYGEEEDKEELENLKIYPLCMDAGGERIGVGELAVRCVYDKDLKEESLMLELVASYVAVVAYNAVQLVARKYQDIELAQDESRRILREENQLYVQNQVLDNCLSTIKHETVYYPNRIKCIIDKLKEEHSEEEERKQVETIGELIAYYKDVFSILSSCAARQLEEVTFRRGVVKAQELADDASRYMKRMSRRLSWQMEWKTEVEDVAMTGDSIQLKFLLENLINEALTYQQEGLLELHIYREGNFVRFDFMDRRRKFSQEELNQLFYPHLSRMKKEEEGVLTGTEYLICKQIIRDHDEFAGRRGCRMNAQQAEGGGFMVWFTIPVRNK